MDGLFEGPPADWEYRNYLKSIASEQGSNCLHRMLAAVDPEAADKLHYNDQKGFIRALEVYKKQVLAFPPFKLNLAVKILNIIA